MEEKNISQFEKVAETEQCVLCGRDTGVPVSEPVEGRKNYVYGCGQLCGYSDILAPLVLRIAIYILTILGVKNLLFTIIIFVF